MGRGIAAALVGALLIVGLLVVAAPDREPAAPAARQQGAQGLASAPPTAAPESAGSATPAEPTCIYLVRGLKESAGLYLGDFLVLRRAGAKLRGYGGSFYSEGYDVRATISGSRVRIGTRDPYDRGSWESVTRKWIESQDRISGWQRVSRADMGKYSGGYVPLAGEVCG